MCVVMKWRIFHKSSIWLTVIVQRCRSFRTSWKQSVSLSLSLSHLCRTEIWVNTIQYNTILSHTTEIEKRLIRCRHASVNVSCYWVFLYLCSLSLLILNESDGPHSCHLPLLSLSLSLSLPPSLSLSLPLLRSPLFPPKFLCMFPSQIAMYYNSEVCCPFPDVSLALFPLVRQ